MKASKKILYISIYVLLFALAPAKVKATHAAGGELIYEWLSDSTYRFYLKFYRDCSGTNKENGVNLCYSNSCNTYVGSAYMDTLVLLPNGDTNGLPVSVGCKDYPTRCSSTNIGSLPGYREWWYSCIVHLPFRCDSWKFSVNISARNTNANLSGGQVTMHIEASLNNLVAQGNSSPYFSVKPVPYVCINQPYTYNNGVVDPDGDSLGFEMLLPLTASTGSPNACPPGVSMSFASSVYNLIDNPLLTLNTFSLSPTTGQMSFTPSATGVYALTMRVNEYRNSILIGSVLRDIQVLVLANCNTIQPTVDIVPNSLVSSALINGRIEGCAGVPMQFCFNAKSADKDAVLVIRDNHGDAAPGSSVLYSMQGKDSVRGCFFWTPPAKDGGLKNFTVTVKDSACKPPGISVSQTYVIPIFVRPIRGIYVDTFICIGDTIKLVPIGGTSFVWSVLPGGSPLSSLSCTGCATPTAKPTLTTQYVVLTNYSEFCARNVDTVNIEVKQIIPPSPSVSSNSPVCENDSITLFAGKIQDVTYKWTGPDFSSTDRNPVIYKSKPVNSGIYKVISIYDKCPSPPTSINVVVNPKPDAPTISTTSPACEGDTIKLTASTVPGANYYWINDTSGFKTIGQNPVIVPAPYNLNGLLKAYVKVNGCLSDTVSTVVVVNPIVTSNIKVLPSDTICQYDTITVFNNANNPATASFLWGFEKSIILSGDSVTPYRITYPKFGSAYIKLAVSNLGCYSADSLLMSIKPSPTAQFVIDKDGCVDEEIELLPYLDFEAVKYNWSLAGAEIIDTTTHFSYHLAWHSQGEKNILLELTGLNGCIAREGFTVHIHDKPIARIISFSRNEICTGDTISLKALEADNNTYQWQPGRYFKQHMASTDAVIESLGFVQLKVTSEWGCINTDSVFINAQPCCDIDLPNAFTPNGDGLNDRFHILTEGNHFLSTFIIKNRWGQTIFKTGDEHSGWDGMFRGEPQDIGTYFYYIRYKCSNDIVYEKKGEFELIR